MSTIAAGDAEAGPPKTGANRVTRGFLGWCSGRTRGVVWLLIIFLLSSTTLWAEQKDWNAEGTSSSWIDDANWYPTGAPTATDDAKIDLDHASATIPEAFQVQSLTLGGKKESTLSVSNFITGTVAPSNVSDDAVLNRKDGHLILIGSTGRMKLKGAYKDSEETIAEEPSFLLYVQ